MTGFGPQERAELSAAAAQSRAEAIEQSEQRRYRTETRARGERLRVEMSCALDLGDCDERDLDEVVADTIALGEMPLDLIDAMPAVSRAFELLGQINERFTSLVDAVADLDSDEVSIPISKAQYWVQISGERVAQMRRRGVRA